MNARQAQLTEQRRNSTRLGFSGLGTRILNPKLQPANSAVSSIAQKVDQQMDEIMYKKWQAGVISDNEYLAYKEKSVSRPYVSPEEKELINIELKTLRVDIEDKKMYEAYKSGRVSKRQLFTYENNKLPNLAPGSQAYDLQMSTINELSKQIMQEDRQKYRSTQEIEIAKMPGRNTPEEYAKRATLYQQLADQATRDGQGDEASEYLQKSYDYQDAGLELKAKLEQEQAQLDERNQAQQAEKDKQTFNDSVNLLIDDYRNNKIDPQSFMTRLNEFGQSARSSGYVDELDTLTDWFNTAREDSINGYKDWSRGGTGKGKGGGLTDEKKTDIQAKLEDSEFEKAKQALIENIKDKNKLVAAMAELNNRYLNGSPASTNDPEGWLGLKNRYLDLYEKITTTGKGSIDSLNALEKKILSKQKDSKVLQDAIKNPNNYGILYKNDGTAEIFHTDETVTDSKTGNKTFYLQNKNVGNLGNGRFIEGKELLQVNPKGKSIGGTYYGSFEGKTYQWKPGEQAVPKEKYNTQESQEFDWGNEFNKASSWVQNEAGKFLNNFQGTQPEPTKNQPKKQSLDTSRLLANAGMGEYNSQARGYSNAPKLVQANLSTRILPSMVSNIQKTTAPVIEAVKPVIQEAAKVISPIFPKPQEAPEISLPANKINLPQSKITEIKTPQLTYTQPSITKPVSSQLTSPIQLPNALQQASKQQGLKVSIPQETKQFQQAKNVTVQSNPQKAIADNLTKLVKGIGTNISKYFRW